MKPAVFLRRYLDLRFKAEDVRRAFVLSVLITVGSLILPAAAMAQALNITLGTGAGLTARVVQLVGLMMVLSLALSGVAAPSSKMLVAEPPDELPLSASERLNEGASAKVGTCTKRSRMS